MLVSDRVQHVTRGHESVTGQTVTCVNPTSYYSEALFCKCDNYMLLKSARTKQTHHHPVVTLSHALCIFNKH